MNALKPALVAFGAVMTLLGLLWIGQGFGVIRWPASSFMISQLIWAEIGAAMVAVGVFLMWRGLKRPR